MFTSEYIKPNGKKFSLAIMKERKKPQLFVMTESGWEKIAQIELAQGVELFCELFDMQKPSWTGKTYEQLMQEQFPWLAEKEADND